MEEKQVLAKRPPMGWNSWDCYGPAVNEEQLLGNAKYMAKHLKAFGWEYVVCDIQWYEPTASSHEYHKFAPLEMDEYSRLMPAVNRFPSAKGGKGFGPIADKIHEMGLKFGIHIMRGIPRQAVHNNTAILGTDATAREIAHPSSVCKWNTDMYGVDPKAKGAQEYYNSIFQLYAKWGVDFVKVDDIARTDYTPEAPGAAVKELELIRRAIDNCGRSMVLSLSPGPTKLDEKNYLLENANMWRMTDDFWDDWKLLYNMFETAHKWEGVGTKGHWPDCDMLPLGRLCMCNDEDGEKGHYTRFTRDEQKILMTLWCIFRSPLMFGGDLRENDEFTLSLLTNERLLEMHKKGRKPKEIYRKKDLVIWRSKTKDGKIYLAIFNIGEKSQSHKIKFKDLGLTGTEAKAVDIWSGMSGIVKDKESVDMEPHTVECYEIEAPEEPEEDIWQDLQ